MAPLTRLRSNPDDSPSDMMIKHYCQRASEGGLIIIESAAVSPYGRGYLGAPGIYADHHIAGFKKIADTVHTQGGRVFLQLYHSGRTAHVSLQPMEDRRSRLPWFLTMGWLLPPKDSFPPHPCGSSESRRSRVSSRPIARPPGAAWKRVLMESNSTAPMVT